MQKNMAMWSIPEIQLRNVELRSVGHSIQELWPEIVYPLKMKKCRKMVIFCSMMIKFGRIKTRAIKSRLHGFDGSNLASVIANQCFSKPTMIKFRKNISSKIIG